MLANISHKMLLVITDQVWLWHQNSWIYRVLKSVKLFYWVAEEPLNTFFTSGHICRDTNTAQKAAHMLTPYWVNIVLAWHSLWCIQSSRGSCLSGWTTFSSRFSLGPLTGRGRGDRKWYKGCSDRPDWLSPIRKSAGMWQSLMKLSHIHTLYLTLLIWWPPDLEMTSLSFKIKDWMINFTSPIRYFCSLVL